jgi:hypothetical protein
VIGIANHAAEMAPIPIKAGWGPTAYGVWTGVTVLVGGILAAFFKVWPKLRELNNEKRKDELEKMSIRIGELEAKVDQANVRAAEAERSANEIRIHAETRLNEVSMKMVTLTTAFTLAAGELARKDPNNEILRQAKQLAGQAASDDLGWGEAGKQLSKLPGLVREQKEQNDGHRT